MTGKQTIKWYYWMGWNETLNENKLTIFACTDGEFNEPSNKMFQNFYD